MQPTLVFQLAGEGSINVQYSDTLQNSAMTLDGNLLQPPTPHFFNFTTGTSAFTAPKNFTASGGAVIRVIAIVITAGALGSSTGQGVAFFNKVSGDIVSGDTFTGFALQGLPQECPMTPAKSFSASNESNPLRFTVSGVSPTNTAGTPANFGQPLPANASMTVAGWSSIKKFSWIAATSGSSPLLNIGINF